MAAPSGVVDANFVTRLRKSVRAVVKGPEAQRESSIAQVKALVRTNPEGGPEEAVTAVLKHLLSNSAVEREAALKLADILLRRSQSFRSRIISSMDAVLTCTTGCRSGQPLPGPPPAAQQLRATALSVIDGWHHEFGSKCKQMEIAYKFAKSRLAITGDTLTGGDARSDRPGRARANRRREGDQRGSTGGSSRGGAEGGVLGRDEEDLRRRERQVMSMMRDAPAFLVKVRAAIATIETAVSNGLQKSAEHTIFGEVFAPGQLQTIPSGTAGGGAAAVKREEDAGEASSLASLGLVGGSYHVEVQLSAAPLDGQIGEDVKDLVRRTSQELRHRMLPQLETWSEAISGLMVARGRSEALGAEERMGGGVRELMEGARRALDVAKVVGGKRRGAGGRQVVGGGVGGEEEEDELEDVEIAAGAEEGGGAEKRGWADFLSSDDEDEDGEGVVGAEAGVKHPRFV